MISKAQRVAWNAWYQAEAEIKAEFHRVAGQNSEPPHGLVGERYLKILENFDEFCVDQMWVWDGL